MRLHTLFLGGLIAVLITGDAAAQLRTARLAGIAAVVGDSIITTIDVEEGVRRVVQNAPVPPDSADLAELERQVLEQLVDQMLLAQAAARDTTVQVSEEEVTRQVDQQVNQLTTQYGSRQRLIDALAASNMTLQSLREMLRNQRRQQLMIQAYLTRVQQQRDLPPVPEEEIRAAFEAQPPPMLPRRMNFRQVLFTVQPSDTALESARQRADSVYELARAGQDFAELATEWSEGPSGPAGGDLGFFRLGQNIAEFDRAVFAPNARQGDILGPVRTEFGIHVIKLEEIRGSERHARHILIRPTITDEDRARALALGDSLAARIGAGASVDSIARIHAVPEAPIRRGPEPIDSVAAQYPAAAPLLAGVTAGETVGPVLVGEGGPVLRVLIARVTSIDEAREATIDDYRDFFVRELGRQKLLEEMIRELRQRTYVDIRLGQDQGGGAPF